MSLYINMIFTDHAMIRVPEKKHVLTMAENTQPLFSTDITHKNPQVEVSLPQEF